MNTPSTNLTTKKIGLFGGTFDPIHLGHTTPLIDAAKLLGLNEIFIMPAHIPPHKNHTFSSSEHRLNMVKLACDNCALFTLDTREINRKTPSYTVESLKELRAEITAIDQLYFFIGMDSLLNFTRWYCWQEILTLCHLVVMPRPNYCLSAIDESLKSRLINLTDNVTTSDTANSNVATTNPMHKNNLQAVTEKLTQHANHTSGNIYILPTSQINISSTEIRAKLQSAQLKENVLAANVYQYIQQHQLYQKNLS